MCNTNLSYTNTFSIRVTEEMQDMLSYLQERNLLNKTAVIRTAIAEEYKREKIREKGEYHENI